MITPRFEVSQDEEFIIVTMRVPYIKVADMEYSIVETQFTFYAKPYFLRLNFPHEIVEDGREKAQYDVDKGTLIVKIPKEVKGQFFDNLDMLTQLLARKKLSKPSNPLIEVISEQDGGEQVEDDDEETFDWEQTLPDPEESSLPGMAKNKYGFNKQYSDFFAHLQEDLSEIVTIPDPDDTPSDTWRSVRTRLEDDRFDPDHYMADFMMDDEIKAALAYKPIASQDLKRKIVLKKKAQREVELAKSAPENAVHEAPAQENAGHATPAQESEVHAASATQEATPTATDEATSALPPQTAPQDMTSTQPVQNSDTVQDTTPSSAPATSATQDATPTPEPVSTQDATSAQITPQDPDTTQDVTASTQSSDSVQEKNTATPSLANLTPASITSPAFLSPASIASPAFLASNSIHPSDTVSSSTDFPSTSTTTITTTTTSTTATPISADSEKKIKKQKRDEESVPFNDEHREVLMRLPNKECILLVFSFFYLIQPLTFDIHYCK